MDKLENLRINDYSKLSKSLTKSISKEDKKSQGIFFTPPSTVEKNLNFIDKYFKGKKILEPSCGSCEYINSIIDRYGGDNKIKITGVEKNKTIYDEIIKSCISQNVKLLNEDFINFDSKDKYDLIIGNPPYFVIKKSDSIKEYNKYYTGRPNIFIIFILKCLRMLEKNGILSFILPRNFNNCLYYEKTRKYIVENYEILTNRRCNDKYLETHQDTIMLVIRNSGKKSDNKFYTKLNGNIVFGSEDDIREIRKLTNNTTNLNDYGFKVSVGKVVWNQCKNILTDDSSKTRLIYNSDIREDNTLDMVNYKNKDKKNYIDKKGDNKPLLVLNRGYGVSTYKLQYCLINVDFNYLIENHLICITPVSNDLTDEELIEKYRNIIRSLDDERTKKFVELYFGNNTVNTNELCYLLPLYDI